MNCIADIRPAQRSHRPSRDPGVRVGDAERQRAADLLGQAFTQGYLALDEYETRLAHAFDAPTASRIRELLTDLPIDRINRRDPRQRTARLVAARRGVLLHLGSYLAMAVLAIGVWAVVAVTANAWYFWPVWPILGGGIGVISHAIPVHRWARRSALR